MAFTMNYTCYYVLPDKDDRNLIARALYKSLATNK